MHDQYNNEGLKAKTTNNSRTDNIYKKVAEKNLEEMKKDGGITYRLKKAKEKIDLLRKDFQAKNESKKGISKNRTASLLIQKPNSQKKAKTLDLIIVLSNKSIANGFMLPIINR
jgi:hypothetical protein